MQVPVKNTAGEVVGQLDLDERVFGVTPNRAVVHQAVVAQQANARKGTANTLTRGEVAGGGRKPWRQKGTGRARQGSTRAPHWRGGGTVFGPHTRSYQQQMPKQMRRLAMRSVLSDKVAQGGLMVLEALAIDTPKAKVMAELLHRLGAAGSALIVLDQADESVKRASANLPGVRAVTTGGLNLLDVLKFQNLLMTRGAVGLITERLTRPVRSVPGAVAEEA